MAITVGAIERAVVRGDPLPPETSLDDLGELEQQFQVAISGDAAEAIAWTTTDVTFDVEFLDATDQRYSNLTEPQFTHGAVLTSTTPVVIAACVTLWVTDDRGVIVGATVAVGACNPGSTTTAFTGAIHLSFQGFGSLPNEPADPDFASS